MDNYMVVSLDEQQCLMITEQQARHKYNEKSCGDVFHVYLCFEGLLDVCTQCAPFVGLLQSFSCQLHAALHLIDLHQDLRSRNHTM